MGVSPWPSGSQGSSYDIDLNYALRRVLQLSDGRGLEEATVCIEMTRIHSRLLMVWILLPFVSATRSKAHEPHSETSSRSPFASLWQEQLAFGPTVEWSRPSKVDPNWSPHFLPDGIIYRSYWAGLHEPRLGLQVFSERGSHSYWDPTLGARIGLFRYGNDDPINPQGWQIDIEGAAMARLTLDDWRDLDSVDFRGGIPITYGIDNWQFKLGYYHLSSHLGDEFAISNPGSLDKRVNYVRDAVMVGVSWYPVDSMRLYGEAAYAFFADGGAEPLEFQFGTELSRPGITGPKGSPFLALNGHLREEHDFGGDFTAQSGWLWRNKTGKVLRVGGFYFNGKSSQYQFYDDSQQQIGCGIWYDF